MEEKLDATNMEEPCPCPLCGELVELTSMIDCEDCKKLVCKDCGGYERMGLTVCEDCKVHNYD